MTSLERFYTAISGGLPDKVPVLPKIWVDLAAVLTGTELRDAIEDPALAMQVIVDAAVAVGSDGARLFHFPRRKTEVRNGSIVEIAASGGVLGPIDIQGGLATRIADRNLVNLEDPLEMAFVQFRSTAEPLVESIDDVRRIAVPTKSLYEELGFGFMQRRLLKQTGGKIALLGDCASATLAFCILYRKMENSLLDLAENPRLAHRLMEKGVEIAVEKGKFNIDTGIKVLRLNDSVANTSVISPHHWRQFIYPHMKAVCDELHAYNPDVRIYCHICGDVMPILSDLIATGLDCIGPLDPLGGFTVKDARCSVGNRVALMGGVDTLSFINDTPEDIYDQARVCIEGAGLSGYILGSGCVVPRTARRDNLLALAEAARGYGQSDKT